MESRPATYSLMCLQDEFPADEFPAHEFPAEVSSWDFSTNVLGGLDLCMKSTPSFEASEEFFEGHFDAFDVPDATPELTGPITPTAAQPVSRAKSAWSCSAELRKQKKNRQAQQRFRKRQWARAEALEAQVTATMAHLQRLQQSQQQLEARNALLESVASFNVRDTASSSMGDAEWSDDSSADANKTIILTVLGGPEVSKTVDDVGKMPFTEFSTLYAAYTQKIGNCLTELAYTENNTDVEEQMRTWMCECGSLQVFLAAGNLQNFVAYSSSRLDGSMGPGVRHLPEAVYRHLLAALELTEAQKGDIMHLRKLFYSKLGALSRHRKELQQQVPVGALESSLHASARLAGIISIAQQLHDSAATEFKVFMQLTSAYRRGILTAQQRAVSTYEAFPYIADVPRTFEVLATLRHETPIALLATPTSLDDFESNAEWLQVVNFLKRVTKDNIQHYVPLVST
ncbi:TPA: hypothetical protein ACH3X1_014478 [Trebouxia sp. C0004]